MIWSTHMPFHIPWIFEFSSTLVTHMFIFHMNFGFMVNDVSFGICCIIAEITFEIFFRLVNMNCPLVIIKWENTIKCFATYITAESFLIFGCVIIFLMFIDGMPSKMNRRG